MSSTGDSEKTAQRSNRIFGPLFSKKPEGVAHFVDLISETLDVNVPGTSGNTASIPETPKTETGLKQPNIVEIINIDTDDETNCDPNTSNSRIDDPDNPYTYQCNLNRDKLEKLAEDDSEEMDDDTLKAFLNIIRIESGKPVIVISSHYRKRVLSLGFTKSLYDGNLENFEVALIPVHMPCPEYAHWVLGIYRRNKSILYYDSLGITYGPDESKDGTTLELLTEWVAETLKSAVREITGDTQLNPKIEAVPLDGPQFDHHSPKHKINPQMDGVNCGFHVALIAEAFVMNNEVVFLEKFDIAVDRTRILDILSGLRNDNYRYIPRDVCYASQDVDLDLGMKQLDVLNASDKVLDSFEYATMKNECVEKLATKDEENAPDNVIEKMSQLVESAESNTLKNDQSKARNQRQSATPAPNSEEAPSKPDQETEKTEVTTQHICKGTEDPEKPNLETTVQLKTKDDSEKDANDNKHDGPKVPEADRTSLLSLQIFSVISIPPMAPLSSSQAENSDQRSEPAKMPASSQETPNIKEIVMPEADGRKKTPKFTQSKIRSNTVVKKPENVAWKPDVVPYLTRRFLQTSQTNALDSALPDLEQNHNASATDQTAPDLPVEIKRIRLSRNESETNDEESVYGLENGTEETLTSKSRAHVSRKANRRESNKSTVQSSSKPKVRLQLTKKRQLDVGPKSAVNGYTMSKRQNALSLDEKQKIIKAAEKQPNSNKSALARQLSHQFGRSIPRTTIIGVLKEKEKIQDALDSGSDAKRARLKTVKHENLDKEVLTWHKTVMSHPDVTMSGPLLTEKAKEFAHHLGIDDFKASHGWLEKFKRRNSITFVKKHGV